MNTHNNMSCNYALRQMVFEESRLWQVGLLASCWSASGMKSTNFHVCIRLSCTWYRCPKWYCFFHFQSWFKYFPKFTVVLMATSPAYFRGFTLIALKDGREGTADNDYAGQFQVSSQNAHQFTLHGLLCCDKLSAVQTAVEGGSFACLVYLEKT